MYNTGRLHEYLQQATMTTTYDSFYQELNINTERCFFTKLASFCHQWYIPVVV